MVERASEEVRQKWKEHIQHQIDSGLSVNAWCLQNNIDTHKFRYWQKQLSPKPRLDRSSFEEISDRKKIVKPHEVGLILECQGIYIHVSERFNPSTLRLCLKLIKETTC